MKSLLAQHRHEGRKVANAKKSGSGADNIEYLNGMLIDGSHILME
jgi:hypothetical protein